MVGKNSIQLTAKFRFEKSFFRALKYSTTLHRANQKSAARFAFLSERDEGKGDVRKTISVIGRKWPLLFCIAYLRSSEVGAFRSLNYRYTTFIPNVNHVL